MARHAGAYRGEKRRKELERLKKQEQKRSEREQKKGAAAKGQGPPVDWGETPPQE